MTSGLIIEQVLEGSIAAELEIEAGDTLLAVNGVPLRDLIDFQYLTADDQLLLDIRKADGELWEVEVEREEGEPLGLIFPAPAPLECGNRCLFCFVHQLPKGLRSPLYVKDEDYRLSFLFGNYVTLANIGDEELARIKEQRLSPLYISVHSTDNELRQELLGRSAIRPVLSVMEELAAAGITMHTQVVLCPGINDGVQLEKTVQDLAALYPAVASLAVVPVGLTSHRKRLPHLEPVTSRYARDFVAQWQASSEKLAQQLGAPFLFLADEFFLKGEIPFPALASYGDFPQLENGVGMIPLFQVEAEEALEDVPKQPGLHLTVVTGHSPYLYLQQFIAELSRRSEASLQLVAISNRLFGPNVTVTGLVAGKDIIDQLAGRKLGEAVIIPDVMLKEGAGLFLDDLSVADLEEALGSPVWVVPATPAGLVEALRF
jgi:putative radical SAM enzyme (TIGR03279 family)